MLKEVDSMLRSKSGQQHAFLTKLKSILEAVSAGTTEETKRKIKDFSSVHNLRMRLYEDDVKELMGRGVVLLNSLNAWSSYSNKRVLEGQCKLLYTMRQLPD